MLRISIHSGKSRSNELSQSRGRRKRTRQFGLTPERLEQRQMFAGDIAGHIYSEPLEPVNAEVALATVAATPLIAVGSKDGSHPVTPDDRIDLNVPTSPFTGVVSIEIGNGGLCTGTLVSPRHVLTAAHCFDSDGGQRDIDGELRKTGDGVADVSASDLTIYFNHDNASNDEAGALASIVTQIVLHPNWSGLNNVMAAGGPQAKHDIAMLTLSEPGPSGVQIYSIARGALPITQEIMMVGYGTTGSGTTGYDVDSYDHHIKRTGSNVARTSIVGFEEMFFYDFDGPNLSSDSLQDGPSLGNDVETITGNGDSGGPSLVWDDVDTDGQVEQSELKLFGINTGTLPFDGSPPGFFGSLGVGMIANAYLEFIDSVLPANHQPTLHPQETVSGDLELLWSQGADITEIWLFPEETGAWNEVSGKYKAYGGAKSLVIPDLPDGTYYAAARGWWKDGSTWEETSFTSTRVAYEVKGAGKYPLIQTQQSISNDLEVRWTEGTDITEVWIFETETGGWDRIVSQRKVYGGAKNVVVPNLEEGTYYVAARGWWSENGTWQPTPFSQVRAPYRVTHFDADSLSAQAISTAEQSSLRANRLV